MASFKPPGVEICVIDYEYITVFFASKVLKGDDAKKQETEAKELDEMCRFIAGRRLLFDPEIGEVVGVYLKNDKPKGEWVRGRIEQYIKRVEASEYKVWLIDRGELVTSKRLHMTKLPSKLAREPPAVKEVGLYGVLPVSILNQSARIFLTDFFHRGSIHFKKKKSIGPLLFGDICVLQDGQVVSLTSHLLANGLVKKVDNFEQEAKQFYSFLSEDTAKEDGKTCPVKKDEGEQTPQSSTKITLDQSQNDKKEISKNTGYSSSEDEHDRPFHRPDAVLIPAGFNFNSQIQKNKKFEKSSEEPIFKNYFQLKKEVKEQQNNKEINGKNMSRPKKSSSVKSYSTSENQCNKGKPSSSQGVHKETNAPSPQEKYEKVNYYRQIFEPEKDKSVKMSEPTQVSNEGKGKRAFNLNIGKKVNIESSNSFNEGKKVYFESPSTSFNEEKKVYIESPSTSFNKDEVFNSSENESKNFTSSSGVIDDSLDTSMLSKRQRNIKKCKDGLAIRELISCLTKEEEKEMCLQDPPVCKLEENVERQKSTPSSQARPHLENQGKERLNNSAGSAVDYSLNQNMKYVNLGTDSKSRKGNSSFEKRKRVQENLRKQLEALENQKQKEAEMSMDSETSGRDMSNSFSQSECSEDSFNTTSKPVQLSLNQILDEPNVQPLEEEDNYIDYVDASASDDRTNSINEYNGLSTRDLQSFVKNMYTSVGVLIHSEDNRLVRPASSLNDCFLDGTIIQALESRGMRGMNRIQRLAYPTILARRNIAMISPPRSGKTYGYVVPISSSLLSETYRKLPDGNGPRALVVTPCWETGAYVAHCFRTVSVLNSVVHCYGGGAEVELRDKLLDGCDVVVTTPRCLLRLLDYDLTNLTRLCHLVFDDADILFNKFKHEMMQLMMAVYTMETLRMEKKVDVDVQVVLAARRWTPPVSELVTNVLYKPILCISSQLEACVYAGIKPTVIFVQADKKMEKLVDYLKEVEGKLRTVVMCRSKDDVKTVYGVLTDLGVKNVIAAHEDLTSVRISEVPGFWNRKQSYCDVMWNESTYSSQPIMIRSDEVLEEVPVTNANVLIHYNMSNSKKTFSLRFVCLMENYKNVLREEPNPKPKPQVVIFLDEENDLEVPGVMEFMERLGTVLPESLQHTVEEIEKLKDASRMAQPLCDHVKEFGECWDVKQCTARHLITKELDTPDDVPRKGWVKLCVQHVHNASHFSATLLEHAEEKDQWRKLPPNLLTPSRLINHFAIKKNKRMHGDPEVGDVAAVEVAHGVYQRAVVLDITAYNRFKEPVRVDIRLMENGRYDNALVTGLWHLPPDIAALPPSIVDVYLCGVRPKDLDVSWPPAPGDWMEQTLRHTRRESPAGCLVGKIKFALKGSLWLEPVDYQEYLPSMDKTIYLLNLREDLLKTNNATENCSHLPALHKLCEKAGIELRKYNLSGTR